MKMVHNRRTQTFTITGGALHSSFICM